LKRLLSQLAVVGLLLTACGSSGDNEHTGGSHDGAMPAATAGADHGATAGKPGTATPGAGHSGMPGMDAEGTVTEAMSFDQMFIAAMIPHHESATDMAKVARTNAEHPETKQLANQIITTQQGEIGQMRAWYKEWYGTAQVPEMDHEMMGSMMPGMDMGDMGMEAQDLSAAKPFDKAFIDAMIPHHESAIAMSRQSLKQAKRAEIKQLAREIIASQQKEIDQMKRWRTAWYGS
jgi:uncharacterized protein (DUF305 family)